MTGPEHYREAAKITESLPLTPAVMAMGGIVAEAYRRALNDAASNLREHADRLAAAEQPTDVEE